jgi:two-component system response regulator FixJ
VEREPIVHLVDDDPAYLDSLGKLVGALGFRTACYASGDEFLSYFDGQVPGCLVLDLKMPNRAGLAVLEELSRREFPPSVIVLTGHADVTSVTRAFRHGAVAFLEKRSLNDVALQDAIRQALAHDGDRRQKHAKLQSSKQRVELLTDPELRVLEMLVAGTELTNIAQTLGISRRTVETRRAKIMGKLGVSTLPELLRVATELGVQSRRQQ